MNFRDAWIDCREANSDQWRQQQLRIAEGIQCPECYGPNVTTQYSRYSGKSEDKFSCRDCGCQWSRRSWQWAISFRT